MGETESRHVEWQSAVMNQIAALSGGGLVASASLLWPKAPLPNAPIIAVAWGALGLATIAAVAANYLSATGNAFAVLRAHQEDMLPLVRLDGRDKVEQWIHDNKKKADWRTKLSFRLGITAPWLFSGGVVLLATWAALAILK
jgi:hypothetical protein